MSVPPPNSNHTSQDVNLSEGNAYAPSLDQAVLINNLPVDHSEKIRSKYKNGNKNDPTTGSYATRNKSLRKDRSEDAVANGSDIRPVGVDFAVKNYAQQLNGQGYDQSQIHDLIQKKFGVDLSSGDVSFLLNGFRTGVPNQYPQYSTMSKKLGTEYTYAGSADSKQLEEAKEAVRRMKRDDADQKQKIHMILLQIMMGDIAGALRSYAVLRDRDDRNFSRIIMDKLDKVRSARTQVIRNFANTTPPRAYTGSNTTEQGRANDRSAKYTQYVQMSTQLMSELQNTEKELVDAQTQVTRDNQTFWETYASFRDQEFRTADRVMSVR